MGKLKLLQGFLWAFWFYNYIHYKLSTNTWHEINNLPKLSRIEKVCVNETHVNPLLNALGVYLIVDLLGGGRLLEEGVKKRGRRLINYLQNDAFYCQQRLGKV